MAEYRNDLAWDYLSNLYSASPANATLQDLYYRWMVDNNLSYGDLGGFFTTATGIANAGDAEFEYWKNKNLPFSPLDLAPALWLDASDAATITASSGAVSEWRDKSGNARHVSQGTAANQPTTGVDTLNGLNVLSFAFDSLVSASWTLAQPFTTIFVFRTSSATQQAFAILMDGARLGSGARAIVFANASNIGNVSSMDAGTRVDTGALTTSTSYAWASTFNGASSSSRRGGVATTINPGTSGIASGVQISSAVVSTVSFTGTIAEVIVVGSTLTAQQMTDLATYISEKWGVTL